MFNPNQSPKDDNQKPKGSAVDLEKASNLDADGNPRSLQKLPDGTMAFLSNQEYQDAVNGLGNN
ncbi:MAG: hypothetical protein AAB681_00855 [Patescibacteria group bacterium]